MIRETCSCGGSFVADYGGDATFGSTDEARAVTAWRETHRHEPKVAPDYEGLWRDAFETVLTAAQGLADEPPAPECDHVWIAWGSVTELIAEYRCQRCDARKAHVPVGAPECDHPEWMARSSVEYQCVRCGQCTPQHEHDWDPGPNDFTGPARCRVCGITRRDNALGVPPDGVPSTDPAGGS